MEDPDPEPEPKTGCRNFLKITSLTLAILGYELISFVAYLSLSIGAGAGVKLLLKIILNYHLDVSLETFCSWYTLATCTEIHLKLYRKCVYPLIRGNLRKHPHALQGFPRAIYFILYCISIYGLFYEYEAVHNYLPLASAQRERHYLHPTPTAVPFRNRVFSHVVTRHENHGHGHGNGSGSARQARVHFYYVDPKDFAPEAPNAKIHTAMFLMMMSYIIYSSGQILCIFLLRILKGIPFTPMFPQFYATFTMMILQIIMTSFYAFPILMCLVACHMFHVDGISTYLFTFCLALCVAVAAGQLESESPFPTQGRMAPYFYFEGQHRARINVLFLLLPLVAFYFFNDSRSYPLTAHDTNFTTFTFWLQLGILHTVKSLYLTTWRPTNPIEFVIPGNQMPPREVFNMGPIIPYPNNPFRGHQRPQEGVLAPAQNFQIPPNNNNFNASNNLRRSRSKSRKHTTGELDEISIMNERENETQRSNNNAIPHIITRATSTTLQQQQQHCDVFQNPIKFCKENNAGEKDLAENSSQKSNSVSVDPESVPDPDPDPESPSPTAAVATISKSEKLVPFPLNNDVTNDNNVIAITDTTSSIKSESGSVDDEIEIEKIFQDAQDQKHSN